MSPVTEVAIYLEKAKIQRRIQARRADICAAMNPVYRPTSRVRTTPPTATMAVDEVPIIVIDDDDEDDGLGAESDDSARTMTYPESTDDIPTAQPAGLPRQLPDNFQIPGFHPPEAAAAAMPHPVIPMTLVQAWLQVQRSQRRHGDTSLGRGMCSNGKCIYCTGDKLRQYYALVERLVQLDKEFWSCD